MYGPGEKAGRYGTVIEIFRQHYLKGTTATVNGPGTQTRNYTHVDDTIDGLILVGEKGLGDEFGIGAKELYSPIELCTMFGISYDIVPQRKTSRPSANINTERVQELGWTQKHNLSDYINSITK